jgi:hypothetical protein
VWTFLEKSPPSPLSETSHDVVSSSFSIEMNDPIQLFDKESLQATYITTVIKVVDTVLHWGSRFQLQLTIHSNLFV